MTWARRRQLSYLFGLFLFFVLVGLSVFLVYRPQASCFDGRQNQDETGIDCGGVCSLACVDQVQPLKIFWSRPLLVKDNQYDLLSLVENPNPDLGTRQLFYRFSLYSVDNILLATREGQTFVNPGEKFVIFESRLATEGQKVGRVFLEFPATVKWEKISPSLEIVELERQEFINQPKPLLRLAVNNTSSLEARDLEIVTILSDINNNAFAASATILNKLMPMERREISFTWPEPFEADPSYVDSFWRVNVFQDTN